MNVILQVLFWISAALVVYVYLGYPALLLLLSRLKREPSVTRAGDFEPSVSLIIAAHNEEAVIAQKLENSLLLDYPRDRLEIIVASNGSTDRTDEMVRSYQNQGIILFSTPEAGKTIAQNLAVPQARGEIVVFTDADAVYEPETLRMLIRNFADARVGLVHGDSIATHGEQVPVGKGTGTYLRYEGLIKKLESRLGACVTAYGGILAIRKRLFEPIPPHLMEDFALPVLTLAQGYRAIFRPEAMMYEKARQTAADEFMVRVRIVAQDTLAFFALLPRLLRPFQALPILLLVSHKLLRWLIPFFLAGLFFASLALSWLVFYRWMLIVQIVFYLLAAVGYLFQWKRRRSELFYIPLYFCLVNAAALVGMVETLSGLRRPTWQRAESSR